jgi:ABC-type uncharacterized transport system permease subunit
VYNRKCNLAKSYTLSWWLRLFLYRLIKIYSSYDLMPLLDDFIEIIQSNSLANLLGREQGGVYIKLTDFLIHLIYIKL